LRLLEPILVEIIIAREALGGGLKLREICDLAMDLIDGALMEQTQQFGAAAIFEAAARGSASACLFRESSTARRGGN